MRVTATLPDGGKRLTRSPFDQWFTRLAVMSPARLTMVQQQQSGAGNKPVTKLTVASPQLRVRNDELMLPRTESPYDPDASTASVAGDYYVALELEPVASAQLKGVATSVRLAVAVDGSPHGQPAFAEASAPPSTATPSAPPATTAPSPPPGGTGSDDQDARPSSPALLIGLGAGAALVFVGVAAGLRHLVRRSRPERMRRP